MKVWWAELCLVVTSTGNYARYMYR